MPSVVIVIPHCNGKEILLRCLESLQNDGYDGKRVLLVDNASTDDSVIESRKAYPWLEVLSLPQNLGFSGGVNAGIRHAEADIIVLLNNDTVVSPGWLQPLVDALESNDHVAAVQPKLRSWFDKELFDYAGGAGGEGSTGGNDGGGGDSAQTSAGGPGRSGFSQPTRVPVAAVGGSF